MQNYLNSYKALCSLRHLKRVFGEEKEDTLGSGTWQALLTLVDDGVNAVQAMPEAGGWQLKWGRHGKYISGHKANIFQETQKRHFCLLYIHNSHPSHFYIENQHTMCGSLRGDTSVMMIMSVNDSTPSFCRRNKGKTREEWRELIWVDYTNSNRGMVDIISRPGGLTTAQPEQLPVHAKKKYNSLEVFPWRSVRHCAACSLSAHPSKVDVWVSLFVESYQGDGQLVRLADWRRQSAMIITRVQCVCQQCYTSSTWWCRRSDSVHEVLEIEGNCLIYTICCPAEPWFIHCGGA